MKTCPNCKLKRFSLYKTFMLRPGKVMKCEKCDTELTFPLRRYILNGIILFGLIMCSAWLTVDLFKSQNTFFIIFYIILYQFLLAMFTPLIKK
ncbi:hypothetical protein RJG79_04935 [Mycoplasmatota bacterium WC44]